MSVLCLLLSVCFSYRHCCKVWLWNLASDNYSVRWTNAKSASQVCASLFHIGLAAWLRAWEWIQIGKGERGETDSVLNTEGQTPEWHLKSLCVCRPSFSSIARYSAESVFWCVDVIERNQVKAGPGGATLPGSLAAAMVQYLHWYLETIIPGERWHFKSEISKPLIQAL